MSARTFYGLVFENARYLEHREGYFRCFLHLVFFAVFIAVLSFQSDTQQVWDVRKAVTQVCSLRLFSIAPSLTHSLVERLCECVQDVGTRVWTHVLLYSSRGIPYNIMVDRVFFCSLAGGAHHDSTAMYVTLTLLNDRTMVVVVWFCFGVVYQSVRVSRVGVRARRDDDQLDCLGVERRNRPLVRGCFCQRRQRVCRPRVWRWNLLGSHRVPRVARVS